jgi:hypothetical protein
MDLGQIIYVVAIVAYFLYRASSKKKNTTDPDTESTSPDAPQKGFTFEELLREIRESQTPKIPELEPEPVPLPKPKSTYIPPIQDRPVIQPANSREEIVSEGEDYEVTTVQPNSRPFYTDSEGSSAVAEQPRSISYEIPDKRINRYSELLKNPKSFRDAVVVSEILKPKHF